MLMMYARWRKLMTILAVALPILGGCRSSKTGAVVSSPMPDRPKSPAFHFVLRPNSVAQPVTVLVDGQEKFRSTPGSGEERFSVLVSPGWHDLATRASDGSTHRAMIEGNRDKWIRIRGEAASLEGFRVHVTEYPIE